jgi:hypothetical protein
MASSMTNQAPPLLKDTPLQASLALPLLMLSCWGFHRPRLKQGAAETAYFELGGVSFRD